MTKPIIYAISNIVNGIRRIVIDIDDKRKPTIGILRTIRYIMPKDTVIEGFGRLGPAGYWYVIVSHPSFAWYGLTFATYGLKWLLDNYRGVNNV